MRGAEMACGAKMYTGEDIRRLKRIATGFEGALRFISLLGYVSPHAALYKGV